MCLLASCIPICKQFAYSLFATYKCKLLSILQLYNMFADQYSLIEQSVHSVV